MKLKYSASKYLLILATVGLLAAGCAKAQPQTANQNTNAATQVTAEQNNTAVITYQGEEGKNALELLKAKYPVKTKEFPGAGEFVESINGVTPETDYFWAFYVNGATSNVGAGQYVTKTADKLEWRLEKIQPQ
jgi:hypothetical protein